MHMTVIKMQFVTTYKDPIAAHAIEVTMEMGQCALPICTVSY
jgi:hypothetical protein